jgi:ribonuclease HII
MPARKTVARPTSEWEKKSGHPDRIVAGVDEVGRGCLAGPVVAAAVVLPSVIDSVENPWILEITDSKLLSPARRAELAPRIAAWVRASCIAQASVEEIDRINIYHASHLAMIRAIDGLGLSADHLLVDGNVVPKGLKCTATAIVKGDQKSLSIACASILAKEWRDQLMKELGVRYPGYGFDAHKGYSTPEHVQGLERLGACAIHRRSFAPVARVMQLFAGDRDGPSLPA